jgi:diguanylate cyclase
MITLGHEAGDVLLIKIARRLKEVICENDYVARIGGDEFTIIVDNIKNFKPGILAEKIVQAIIKTL